MRKSRPRQKQRAFAGKDHRIERLDRTAGLPIKNHVAARPKTIETLLERVCAHRVIDDVNAAACGEALHFRYEILLAINDHFIGTGAPREFGFRFGTNGGIHGCTEFLCDLRQQQPNATGGSVNERLVSGLERKGAVREVVSGHAL